MIAFERKMIIASTAALSIMRVCKICPKRNDPHISFKQNKIESYLSVSF